MKNFYAIVACSLLMFSCSIGSEDKDWAFENSEDVIGKWNYFERTLSIGTSEQIREKVENDGIIIEFLPNSELVSEGFFECDQASYKIEGDVLSVRFDSEAEQEELQYRLSWEGENLVLVPLSPSRCIEGCSQIFRRTSPLTNN